MPASALCASVKNYLASADRARIFHPNHLAHYTHTREIIRMKLLAALSLADVFSAQAAPKMIFKKSGKDFGIDPRLLMTHLIQESRMRNNALNIKSSSGTHDFCNIQINSPHFNKLENFNNTCGKLLK
jgi:hypothetical protein